MKRLFSLVLFCMVFILSEAQNLVINPGFETWQKLTKPDGWTTALACTKDSVIVRSGSYSCRQITGTESKELGQLIAVSEGKSYRFSLWYINDLTATGNGCRIWSNWRDADGNPVTDDASLPQLHSGYLKSDVWKEYTADLVVPVNAAYFNLVVRTLPNSVTRWDDIKFEENFPTGTRENSGDEINIYPNPACNYLYISNLNNSYRIEIVSVTGIVQLKMDIINDENISLPVSNLVNGIYFIRLYGRKGVIIKKFIKSS